MRPIFGEYECKVDSKGRFVLPSGLKKQLPEEDQKDFVISRGLDPCLVLYPQRVFEVELKRIHARNQYVEKNRAFARMFINGSMPLELDGSSRVLVPKRLAAEAGLDKDLILVANVDRIEIWDKTRYDQWLLENRGNLERLSEEVMGGLPDEDDAS
jgi:MraZ protein